MPFFSDLSVAEWLLINDRGWEPVGLVFGDCSYGVGDQVSSWRNSTGLKSLSDGLTRGQTLALERMRQQAATVDADGVVGVRLATIDIDLEDDQENHPTQHFSAVGSAVRRQPCRGPDAPEPFTSHLSGQDTWALSEAGCSPLGVVFGFGVYHARMAFTRPDRCCEMPDLTRGIYQAREIAMLSMQTQARNLGASGIVGVSIELKPTAERTVTFVATGTAIGTPASGISAPAPRMIIRLND